MAKLTLVDVPAGGTGASAYHIANNNRIETALENTLSRDGTSPNGMAANLDMNGFAILNAGAYSSLKETTAVKGDVSPTLVVNTDAPIQLFTTELTANRTVTLSNTGAVNGDKFRIVRTGLGAFTLDVGGLKTIPNSTAAFVDVSHNGTIWVLTGYATL